MHFLCQMSHLRLFSNRLSIQSFHQRHLKNLPGPRTYSKSQSVINISKEDIDVVEKLSLVGPIPEETRQRLEMDMREIDDDLRWLENHFKECLVTDLSDLERAKRIKAMLGGADAKKSLFNEDSDPATSEGDNNSRFLERNSQNHVNETTVRIQVKD